MALECKKCPYVVAVQPGEKAPPWCPRCGSDLKPATPVVAATAVTEVAGFPAPNGELPTRSAVREESPESVPVESTLPSLPEEEASDTPEEVFPCKLIWPMVACVCAIVCLGIVTIAVSQFINPPPLRKSTPAGLYGVMGMFAIGALVSLYVGFRLAGQKYAVLPDQLIEWQCFKPTVFRWDQIREVYQNVHPGWTTYRVVTRLGREFTLRSEIKNHKRLGELISGRVAARMLPAAVRELEAGRDVRFGPLCVSSAGVVIDGQLEPWQRIGELTYGMNPIPKRGTSRVSSMVHVRIGSSRIELGDIPNFRLFEELARRLVLACVSS
jgi:hypothetical protein